MEKDDIIRIEKMSKTYNGISYVIRDLDLTVKKGEYIQIMGSSGSGKSTLLNLIGLLDNAFEGVLKICGCDIAKSNDQQISMIRSRHIGFIFQAYNLIPNMTVKENIELPMIYSKITPDSRYEDTVAHLMETLGIAKLSGQKIQYLSGGEKQRVAIARALSLKPDLVLADEPTGNLDSCNSDMVFSTLRQLHENGVTVVLVTHNDSVDVGADVKYTLRGGTLTC